MAGYSAAFAKAVQYQSRWDRWNKTKSGTEPDRDLSLETLVAVLKGDILVQNHCYRADEMAQMIDLSREFGFKIRSFHHATEAYKIADLLAREQIGVSIWSDWWGFKMESFDGIPENAALVQQAGGIAIIHSDSEDGIQRLNQDAAKAMYAGRQAGIEVTREQAIRWITRNPAWALGIDSVTGTLETGKAADVVVWSGDPFSVYSKAEQVYNDGWLAFDRNDPKHQWQTDFNLGTGAPGVGR
jgi:imidazolonepropionase-like amidohydrolase